MPTSLRLLKPSVLAAVGAAVMALPAIGPPAFAQSSAPKQAAPNEAEQVLKDSKKQDPETSKEVAECMKQWGPQTQMTKDEWAASCRRTLRYFPENQ